MRNPDDTTRAALERLLQLAGETEARRIVAEIGMPSKRADLERMVLRRVAARLLAERAPRYVIRDRLVSRGISWATAYRVIDDVLNTPGARCLTAGGELRNDGRTLATPQPLESTMTEAAETTNTAGAAAPAAVAAMQARLTEVQDRLATLDIPAARRRAEDLHAEATKLDRAYNGQAIVGWTPGMVDGLAERDAAKAAAKGAKTAVLTMEREETQLRAEMGNLYRLLGAHDRADQARAAVGPARQLVAGAEAKVAACRAALGSMEQLIHDETQAFESARAQAAAQLLEAVKSGGDAGKVKSATRDKIDTLELAKVGAQQELDAALAALQAAGRALAEHEQAVRAAEFDCADLAHRLALAAYVQAAAGVMVAAGRARVQGFAIGDPRAEAFELAAARSASEAAA